MAKRKQYVRNLQDLLDHFGADSATGLNRRVYKDTACGASISVRRKEDGTWIHNGETKWHSLVEIDAFTIQTIVEGSEATVDSPQFVLPVDKLDINRWVEQMEEEADRLWKEANTDLDEEEERGSAADPYQGPKTFVVDAGLALRLFTDWHEDESTDRSDARDYAHRLLTRLFEDAKGRK